MLESSEYLQTGSLHVFNNAQSKTHVEGTQLHLAADPLATLNQPPGICNRFGAEVNGNGVDVRGPRRAESTEALHPLPLGLTPLN